jgi:hypothetical protein
VGEGNRGIRDELDGDGGQQEATNTSRKNFTGDTSKLSLFPAPLKNYRREMRTWFLSCHN